MAIPKFDQLFNPTLEAMKRLGGSGTNQEIETEVVAILNLSEKDASELHSGSVTKLGYRLAWSRNYLKRYGLLENSARSVWSLTRKGQEMREVDPLDVKRSVRALDKADNKETQDSDKGHDSEESITPEWEQELLIQLQSVSPSGFERICQRILREAGFIEVKVTGKTGDGGIDGIGTIRLNLISFKVIFQSKRYKGSISSAQMRDFKGTMVGRAERGLYITTGSFTIGAKQEATRDGSPPIDLVDGDRLVGLMKEHGLGVAVETREDITVDKDWFLPYVD